MSIPSAKQSGRLVLVEVPVVLGVAVWASSQEEAEQLARAQLDRHFGNAPLTQHVGLSDINDINITRCQHQPALEPVQVLIHLGQDGEGPTVYCSAACDVATIRSDGDLENYEESDTFCIPDFNSKSGLTTRPCVGHIDRAVNSTVKQQQAEKLHTQMVFQVIERHQEINAATNAATQTPSASAGNV